MTLCICTHMQYRTRTQKALASLMHKKRTLLHNKFRERRSLHMQHVKTSVYTALASAP